NLTGRRFRRGEELDDRRGVAEGMRMMVVPRLEDQTQRAAELFVALTQDLRVFGEGDGFVRIAADRQDRDFLFG
ncbi:MAG: hypothetical protein IJG25_02960, partial [Thermoguttaceae bacterium]|nr:hypothetical protein [Thermoguttaceae bacterium]